jgi:hypothetical protein
VCNDEKTWLPCTSLHATRNSTNVDFGMMWGGGMCGSQPIMPPPNGEPMKEPIDGGASNGQIPLVSHWWGKEDWIRHVRIY